MKNRTLKLWRPTRSSAFAGTILSRTLASPFANYATRRTFSTSRWPSKIRIRCRHTRSFFQHAVHSSGTAFFGIYSTEKFKTRILIQTVLCKIFSKTKTLKKLETFVNYRYGTCAIASYLFPYAYFTVHLKMLLNFFSLNCGVLFMSYVLFLLSIQAFLPSVFDIKAIF